MHKCRAAFCGPQLAQRLAKWKAPMIWRTAYALRRNVAMEISAKIITNDMERRRGWKSEPMHDVYHL